MYNEHLKDDQLSSFAVSLMVSTETDPRADSLTWKLHIYCYKA